MTDSIVVPRHRRWPLFVMPGLVLLLAAGWSVFWFVAAGRAEQAVDEWRAREAAAGRVYDCAQRAVGGYPFRLEIRCANASVTLRGQMAGPTAPVIARLGEIVVIAQIYDPTRLIVDFAAPASLTDQAAHPIMVANWSTARASATGLPDIPRRVSLVFNDAALERINGAMQVPLLRARHIEMHGRLAQTSTPAAPVLDLAAQAVAASVQDVHPVLTAPFDMDVQAQLSGLRDLTAKPWPERLRDLQAAGGKVDITQARIKQGDLLAIGAGRLGISPEGRLDGEIQMTIAGLEAIVPALGIDKLLESGVQQSTLDRFAPGVKAQDVNNVLGALDRAIPGLTKMVRQNANTGVAASLNALGTEAELEGRKARALALRFVDGAVYLGSLKIAQTPPLY